MKRRSPIPQRRDVPRRKVNPWGPITTAPAGEPDPPLPRIKRRAAPRRTAMKRGPSKKWQDRPDVIKHDDGREVCNKHKPGGLAEYHKRLRQMFYRQFDPEVHYHRCCNCKKRIEWPETTFEHENLRTPGKIDERIEVNGKPLNGASHGSCNLQRGSRKTRIWHGPEDKS